MLLMGRSRLELVETGLLTGGPRDRVAYAKELAMVNRAVGAWVYGADELREATGHVPMGEGWMPEPLSQQSSMSDEGESMVPSEL